MCLQKRDFVRALILQQELAKRLPNDKTINEFTNYLPLEAKIQRESGQDEEGSEYYDEEDEEEEEEKSESETSSDADESKQE